MSGKNIPITLVVGAVDNATYKLIAINDKFKKFSEPFKKVGTAFKTLGAESGIGKFATAMGKVGKAGKDFAGDVLETAAKIAGVTAAAAAAIFGVVHGFSEAGDNIEMMSKRLGLTTDAYQELSYAAKKADVDQETFDATMGKFSKNIAEAAAGSGEALVGFNALGISIRDANGKIKPMDTLLPQVAEKMKNIQNQSVRNAIAAKIFGKEGAKLNGIFEEGAEGLARLRKEAHDVGAVMTPEQIKTAAEFDDGLKSITATLLGVRNTIGAALAPILLGFMEKAQKWIIANREQIEKWAQAFADKLPGAIDAVISVVIGLWNACQPLIAAVTALCDIFGTSNVVFAAAAMYLGGPLLASFVGLAGSVIGAIGPLVKFAWVFGTLIFDALVAVGGAIVALVGWPVLIAAGFVAAAVAIWKYWGPISDFFDGLWTKVKRIFGGGDVNLTNQANAAMNSPQMGPALGAKGTVDASAQNNTFRNESVLKVDFSNMPKGTRVEANKTTADQLDLNMGYASGS